MSSAMKLNRGKALPGFIAGGNVINNDAGQVIVSDASDVELAKAFPDLDPGFEPFGSRVIVQLRSPKLYSAGGIKFPDEVIETEMWNTQIGKVRAIGALAFHDRTTMQPWPEGDWAKVGDYVRIPKFNQDKWFIEYPVKLQGLGGREFDGVERVLFMLINDLDLLAKKTGNPLEVKAYI
jgi:co-chaperonin GroES (HSP10)